MTLAIDLVFIVILAVCAWSGYKKGIIMGIGGLLVIIISLYGGHLLSSTFSYEVIPALKPFASGYLEARVPEQLYEQLGYEADDNGDYDVEFSVHDLYEEYPELREISAKQAFMSLGVFEEEAEDLAAEAVAYQEENEVEFTDAVIQIFCQRITYFLGFLIGFALIAILLTVLGNLLNLSYKLPGLNIVNDILGLCIGLVTGICFCSVLIWVLHYTGKVISLETLESTKVASWFLEKDYFNTYVTFLS